MYTAIVLIILIMFSIRRVDLNEKFWMSTEEFLPERGIWAILIVLCHSMRGGIAN